MNLSIDDAINIYITINGFYLTPLIKLYTFYYMPNGDKSAAVRRIFLMMIHAAKGRGGRCR